MERSRRAFLKGLLLTAAGLAVPATTLAGAEPARRSWALDSSMLTTATSLAEAEQFAAAATRVLAESARATEAFAQFALLRPPSELAIERIVFGSIHSDQLRSMPVVAARRGRRVR